MSRVHVHGFVLDLIGTAKVRCQKLTTFAADVTRFFPPPFLRWEPGNKASEKGSNELRHYRFCEYKYNYANITYFLQVLLLSLPLPVLNSLKMSVELWMSLWAGHWVVETVLISTSPTLPPMLPRLHMVDFWTSPLPLSHNVNWLVSWQAMSIISQYVLSTVGARKGVRVSPW